MTNEIKIKVLSVERYDNMDRLEQWQSLYSEMEIVTMLKRYCDAQARSKSYRERSAASAKASKLVLTKLAESKGMTLDQLLEEGL